MKSIYIKPGKLQEVFDELKDNLEGTIAINDLGYTVAINSEFAKGTIKGKQHDNDMGYFQFNLICRTDIRISMELSSDLPIFFAYCSNGILQHSFGENGIKKSLKKHQTGILKSKSSANSILYFKKNSSVRFSMIRLASNNIEKNTNEELIKNVKNVFFKSSENYFEVKQMDLNIRENLQKLNSLTQKGVTRNVLENRILQTILETEVRLNTDSLTLVAQEINNLSIKFRNEINRIANIAFNYHSERLFSYRNLVDKTDFFINKLLGSFKLLNIR